MSMNEDMDGELKMESIDIKLENIEPDTISNPERNESQVNGHIVLFKSENNDLKKSLENLIISPYFPRK